MPESNGPKQFDASSATQGLPVREDLAGASASGKPAEVDPLSKAEATFPVRFDQGFDKDFRPQEIVTVQQTPKGLAPESVDDSRLLTTGLEDVSEDDLGNPVPTPVVKE